MNTPKNTSFRIPASVDWNEEDLIKKAESLGMNKSEFIIMAVDAFINFDNSFLETMRDRSAGLRVPLYVAIQNTIIAQIAKNLARQEVHGGMIVKLDEFPTFSDESGYHMLTGKALEKYLFDLYVKEFRQGQSEQSAAD